VIFLVKIPLLFFWGERMKMTKNAVLKMCRGPAKIVAVVIMLCLVVPAIGITQSGFGSTHFVVGASTGQVVADVSSGRLEKILCHEGQCHIAHALFCPDDDSRGILLDLLACEKKSVCVAAFMLTDEVIARALIDAKKRGVTVVIVTDQLCCQDARGKVPLLYAQGIEVLVYCGTCSAAKSKGNRSNIMHNKFMVFESNIKARSILWTGSFNFTHSARLRNQENILIVDDARVIDRYRRQFSVLKTRCHPYQENIFGVKQHVAQKQKNGTIKSSTDRNNLRIAGLA
jgi:phosphatidylserine/phosphatidylglycerophosphate/cardiolipin synthase-like enzyme